MMPINICGWSAGFFLALLGNCCMASGSDHQSSLIGQLIPVPAGQFQRDGDPQNISIVSGFLMSAHEITRRQYEQIAGPKDPNPPSDQAPDGDVPAQNIRWYDAISFSNKLSALENLTPVYAIDGETDPEKWPELRHDQRWDHVVANWSANGYRLPTEMEWLWAAMGADKGTRPNANETRLLEYSGAELGNSKDNSAWCAFNAQGIPHGVGTKSPNALGLYDMTGNVWEWNWDWNGDLPGGTLDNYQGPPSGTERLLRGGGWRNSDDRCNNTFRPGHEPEFVYDSIGFRVVRNANP